MVASFTWGASTREVARNVFISHQHTLTVRAGTQSPGAVYNLPSTVGGKQPAIKEAPSWKLKGRARDPKSVLLTGEAYGKYAIPQAHGKQPDAAHRSEPSWTLKGKSRTPVEAGLQSPGPIYNLPYFGGHQPSARNRSAPTPSFSKHSRWADVEREARKNTVPGPGYYG